jgi:hypothetical protein
MPTKLAAPAFGSGARRGSGEECLMPRYADLLADSLETAAGPGHLSDVAEAMQKWRWVRFVGDEARPRVLQQYWRITDHYEGDKNRVRYEWRNVPVIAPELF